MELVSDPTIALCPICNGRHRGRGTDRPDRVLVAEDDCAIANLIAYNVEQAGAEVAIAADGVETFRMLRESPPDLLILDLLLPLQSGWQVLREMRRRPGTRLATIPVLVVSALACNRLRDEIVRLGAQRLLGKPFAVKDLCRSVAELLEEARAAREAYKPPLPLAATEFIIRSSAAHHADSLDCYGQRERR
jgi:DNA-binding response OmpR family regulator